MSEDDKAVPDAATMSSDDEQSQSTAATEEAAAIEKGASETTRSRPYRLYLIGLGLTSIGGLFTSFVTVQKVYAMLGALFIPILALALLLLSGRGVGGYRNGPLATLMLVACLGLFLLFLLLGL